jgi:hypothetical protein
MESAFKDGRQWAWNSTALGLAKECPRKYYYVIVEGWQSKHLSDDITFGHHYARALENYHILRSVKYRKDHDNALRDTIRSTLAATADWEPAQTRKTRQTLIRSIVWYLEEFATDPCTTVQLADGNPAVELTFQFKLSEDITFAGHLDRLVTFGDEYYIQDQKTTGSTLTSNYFRRFTPDNQMSLYTIAGQVIWHLPVKGVMIDAAQIAVGFTRFERGFAFRTEEQCEEWLLDAAYHIRATWDAASAGYPMNDSACQKYGGCAFLEVCGKSPSVRQAWLETNFYRHSYTPFGSR